MNINAISMGYNRVNFGHVKNHSDKEIKTKNNDNKTTNIVRNAIVGIAGAATIYGSYTVNSKNIDTETFYDKLDKISLSDSIKKDTFTITDYNKDKSPDMILYKKDGSKVVVDIKNQEIINAKKNDSIQKDSDERQNIFKSDGNNEKNIFLSY